MHNRTENKFRTVFSEKLLAVLCLILRWSITENLHATELHDLTNAECAKPEETSWLSETCCRDCILKPIVRVAGIGEMFA